MKRSAPPERKTPMPRASAPMNRTPISRVSFHADISGLRAFPPSRRSGNSRRQTGFPAAVKKAVRERARYCCEACAFYLGEYGGQIQHRRARGRGGSRDPLTNSIVNAALLCGTPATGCHGLCESRDRDMLAAGFWIRSWQDPALEPVLLHGEQGGARVWLTAEGSYSPVMPGGAA